MSGPGRQTMNEKHFVDYYEILQVSPNADTETIERVYRLLAKRFHPDNRNTGDADRFDLVTRAYRVLSNPEKRAAYDANYENGWGEQWGIIGEALMTDAGGDQRIQQLTLSMLYVARRRHPSDAGMGVYELEKLLDIAEGQLEFHLWYLKEKGWIERTESGKFAITAAGVDAVAENGILLQRERLLTEGGKSDSEGTRHTGRD